MSHPKTLAYPVVTASNDGSVTLLRSEVPEGDDFFGLAVGTNGTAAAMRRRAIESSFTTRTPFPIVWERHDGRAAVGVTLVPSGRGGSDANPWSGR